MTDAEDTDRRRERQAGAEPLPEARRARSRWAAWFWAIPLAALALVGWLAMKEWVIGSGDVTVTFARAEGLSPGAAVRYRGSSVGRVKDIRLTDDLEHVKVVLRIDGPISDHLGKGTLFWIERPGLSSGEIKNLIAGASVGVQPVDGQPQQSFSGLEEPPVLPGYQPGRTFALNGGRRRRAVARCAGLIPRRRGRADFGDPPRRGHRCCAGGATTGAPRRGRGKNKSRDPGADRGEIRRSGPSGQRVLARRRDIRVDERGLDVELPSLQSLITGAIAFDTPEAFAGAPAGPDAAFRLHGSRDAAKAAIGGPVFAFFVRFPKAVGGSGQARR